MLLKGVQLKQFRGCQELSKICGPWQSDFRALAGIWAKHRCIYKAWHSFKHPPDSHICRKPLQIVPNEGNHISYIWLFRANTTSAHSGLQRRRGCFVQRNKFIMCSSSALKSKQNRKPIGLGPLRDVFTKIDLSSEETRKRIGKGFSCQFWW